MGKSSSIIAVIALIVSLGAGGFIVYDIFFAVPPASTAENQWFDFSTSVYYMEPSEAWGTISGISIDFDVSSDKCLFFIYS